MIRHDDGVADEFVMLTEYGITDLCQMFCSF